MQILVLGAGAIGGYFGGRMAAAGVDVSFLVRERRAEQLRHHGLVIKSPAGDVRLSAKVVTRAEQSVDAVIVTCKAYDLPGAIDAIAPAVGPHTVVLPMLNGMRHLDALDGRFAAGRVLGGLCHIGATMNEAGEIVHLSMPAHLALGVRDPGQRERCVALHAELARGGFAPILSDAVMQDMWEKFVFITAYAGMTCLMRAPIGAIVAADDGAALARELWAECFAVGAAAGHAPRDAFTERSLRSLTEPNSPATSSMFRDVKRGNRTEHEHIVGDMLARAAALGHKAPLLRIVRAHLQAYEAQRPA